MSLFSQFFTWWNGSTWGTRFYTWRKGSKVGEDEMGNIYYESKEGKRWVQYAGYAEPTTIPAGWHGWMHYRVDTPPSDETYHQKDWELTHQSNMTGTAGAYFPRGSLMNNQPRSDEAKDYQAWKP